MDRIEDPAQQLLVSTRFWIQRVFVPIMVCIGVSGNIITVIILTRKRMRCSTNIYLTALAVADIVFLLFVFVLSLVHYDNIHSRKYELYWRFFGLSHWLCDAASSASVWLTVSFTLERYIAVCHPIKGKVLCTENRAKSIIVIVAIFCILTTASTTFEHQLSMEEHCIRNCTLAETLEQSTGNSSQNATIHYFSNNNIVVTNLQNNDPKMDILSTKLIKEIYSNIQPKLKSILSANCTAHPHIIYVPIYQSNITSSDKLNNDVIENGTNNKSENREIHASAKMKNEINEDTKETNTTENIEEDTKEENVTARFTCCDKLKSIGTEYTNLGNNKTYRSVISWYSIICFWLLPLVLIATFNCFLVHAVYNSQRRRRKMTNSQESLSMTNENRITMMLIIVVIVFLICQTPTASFLIYDNFFETKDKTTENIKKTLGNVFNFLLTVNASCNFLLYCVLSKKYRATFKSFFCERRRKRQDTLMLSSTRSKTSSRFNSYKNGFRRNISEYRTPRNLETLSLTSIPRSKSLMVRSPGKSKSSDMNF